MRPAPMPAPLVRLADAAFGYGREPVLRGVDLELFPGEGVGVLGPNGAGKSTLLRGILGLLPPLAGEAVRSTGALGYVPQRETLDAAFPVSVEELVHLGASGRLRGARRLARADRELAAEALERVGLADRARAAFSSLSGGQRQRALIARALVMRPELLVLDEPTSGVDFSTVELILALLSELRAERGLAVLFVTHEVALLRGAVERVLWVCDGAVRHLSADEALAPARLAALFGGRTPAPSLERSGFEQQEA